MDFHTFRWPFADAAGTCSWRYIWFNRRVYKKKITLLLWSTVGMVTNTMHACSPCMASIVQSKAKCKPYIICNWWFDHHYTIRPWAMQVPIFPDWAVFVPTMTTDKPIILPPCTGIIEWTSFANSKLVYFRLDNIFLKNALVGNL